LFNEELAKVSLEEAFIGHEAMPKEVWTEDGLQMIGLLLGGYFSLGSSTMKMILICLNLPV
jgi:hypothetical protein